MNRMEQLIGFVEWERKHHPDRQHIAEWALGEIERLQALVITPVNKRPGENCVRTGTEADGPGRLG